METERTTTPIVAALAALGGLVIGAAVMLAALEARDEGESEVEQRIEELFTITGAEFEYDFVLDELPPRFPRTFPLPPDSDLRGGFETTGELSGDTTVSGFAMFRSKLDPLALRDYFDEAALESGWERAPETGGFTPFGTGSVFCLDPSDEHHASIIVHALNAGEGASDLVLQYSLGPEVQFSCDEGAMVFGSGSSVPQPRVAAAFSAVPIPGTRLGATSSTGTTRGVSMWSSSLVTDADLTAEEAMALTIEAMGEREDIEFGTPVASAEGAIVSIAGDDAIAGPYDGVILFVASDVAGQSLVAELRMTFASSGRSPDR